MALAGYQDYNVQFIGKSGATEFFPDTVTDHGVGIVTPTYMYVEHGTQCYSDILDVQAYMEYQESQSGATSQ